MVYFSELAMEAAALIIFSPHQSKAYAQLITCFALDLWFW